MKMGCLQDHGQMSPAEFTEDEAREQMFLSWPPSRSFFFSVLNTAGVKLHWHKEQPSSCCSLAFEDAVDYFTTQMISRSLSFHNFVASGAGAAKGLVFGMACCSWSAAV